MTDFSKTSVFHKFKLSDSFIGEYNKKDISWGPLGEFVYLRTYSRLKEDGSKERWQDTVQRVVEGTFNIQKKHCFDLKLPWNNVKAQRSAQIMYDKIFNFKFLPPGRGLWMMGTEFVEKKGSACLNNCGFVSTEDIDTRGPFAFSWAMDALMLGVGIGFDAEGADKVSIKKPKETDESFDIPDDREGWVDSLRIILEAFFYGRPMPKMNYSLIRPYGAPINGFGGTASGPAPLKTLHESVIGLLNKRIDVKLSSVDIVDIMNFIAVCVVAGNVRRSAEIALGNPEDYEYVTMKDYKLHPEESAGHRWASNNSILAKVGETDYTKIKDSIALNGEPGIVWLDNIQKYSRYMDSDRYVDKYAKGLNPCGEQSLESLELCCLVETFPSRHDTFEEYRETLKYAYLYAKTVTLLPTHWEETNAVLMKNRRIGTSQSGIVDAFTKHGRHAMLKWCNHGYSYLREQDEIYSNWLCIPKSIKITSVKPSGTVSLLPGVSPGIHYPHSEYYIRRVRIAADSPLVNAVRKAGYHVENLSVGNEETKANTLVISFPVKEKNFSKSKYDATMWEQFVNAADYQRYWADNSVSITVSFNKDEAEDIPFILRAFEDKLKAISFLPNDDHGYVQAPYETIDKETYEKMYSKIKSVDFSGVTAKPEGEKFCDGDTCTIG